MSCYYVGLDVHQASICVAVLNAAGKLVMESVVETSAATVLDLLKGLRGRVELTFEEGTHAAWPYDLLKKTKAEVIVCDPRKNRLLRDGNKSDKVDARKLAQLLRAGLLSPVARKHLLSQLIALKQPANPQHDKRLATYTVDISSPATYLLAHPAG